MAGIAIITEACIDTKDRACVDVCPVQCIYEFDPAKNDAVLRGRSRQRRSREHAPAESRTRSRIFGDSILYVNTEECTSCTACYQPDVCPVGAIYSEEHVPDGTARTHVQLERPEQGPRPHVLHPAQPRRLRRLNRRGGATGTVAAMARLRVHRTLRARRSGVRLRRLARASDGCRSMMSPTYATRLARFGQVRFEDDAARDRARSRSLQAARRYRIVPVGFIASELEVARRAAASDHHEVPNGFVTMLMTDVEGSTGLVERLGGRFGALIDEVWTVLRAAVADARGVEVEARADRVLRRVEAPRSAVDAAVAMQLALRERSFVDGAAVRIRIGIHSGDPTWTAGNYVGLDVNVASRVTALGHGGQIVVTANTREAVRATSGRDMRFVALGAAPAAWAQGTDGAVPGRRTRSARPVPSASLVRFAAVHVRARRSRTRVTGGPSLLLADKLQLGHLRAGARHRAAVARGHQQAR